MIRRWYLVTVTLVGAAIAVALAWATQVIWPHCTRPAFAGVATTCGGALRALDTAARLGAAAALGGLFGLVLFDYERGAFDGLLTDDRGQGGFGTSTSVRLLIAVLAVFAAVGLAAPAVQGGDGPPEVRWTHPWNTTLHERPESVTVSNGSIILRGQAVDSDGIDRVVVQRVYSVDRDGDGHAEQIEQHRYIQHDVNHGEVRVPVDLGTGANTLNISVVDGDGYPRNIGVTVTVDDDRKPTATLWLDRAGKWVRVYGTVRDNVQVAGVRVRLPGGGVQYIQTRQGDLSIRQNRVWIDQRVPATAVRNGNLTAIVTDRAGNSQSVVVNNQRPTPTATPTPQPTPTPATPTPRRTSTATAVRTTDGRTTAAVRSTASPSGNDGSILDAAIPAVGVLLGLGALVLAVGGGGR